jgi:hypothetical protein
MSDRDELAAAFKRTAALGSADVDRKGWTKKQWADDAERLMGHIDGAVIALKNGHVIGLLARIQELTPRTVTTVEELDALPELSVIRNADWVWERSASEWWGAGSEQATPSRNIFLPATVLYPAGAIRDGHGD